MAVQVHTSAEEFPEELFSSGRGATFPLHGGEEWIPQAWFITVLPVPPELQADLRWKRVRPRKDRDTSLR